MSIEQALTRDGSKANAGLSETSHSGNYFLKAGYQTRSQPRYFEDDVTDKDDIVWQPDVYPFAAAIARKLHCKRIIDVGCGRAHKLLQLANEFEITGVDFGSNLNHCRKAHPDHRWVDADFEGTGPLPFSAEDTKNAVVICSDVIEHMMSPEALLTKIRHLLEHALVAVISTPERDLTWGTEHAGPPPNPCHTMEWNLPEFRQLLESEGLVVEYAGITRSHDRDPARKTILAVVGNSKREHLARSGSGRFDLQRHLAELNGDSVIANAPSDRTPKVSVIVPTYIRPEWLGETLRSILQQNYSDFEVIVVNDSGPDIGYIVEPLNSEGRIRVITHDQNKGLAAARNTGIRAARGKWIAYLDDDDIFLPDHLATLVHHLESTGGKVAYTDAYRATQRKEGNDYVVTEREVLYSHDWDADRILVQNFVPVLCFMHEKECIEQAGWFDESLTTHEDWDLWMRMSRHYAFTHLKRVTCEFRWRDDGSSMSSQRRADFLRTAEVIYKKSASMVAGRHDLAWKRQQHLLEISHSLGSLPEKPTPDTLLVSIIIPVFNKLELTRACIEAIHRETKAGTFEIVVVDNASADGTREYLASEESAGRLRAITNPKNYGFSIGCNQGMRAARGGFYLLLNNDTVPLPGWLEPMLEEFLYHQNVAAVGSCLLYPGGELIQHAGVRIGAGGGNLHPYHAWRLQRLDRVPEASQSRDCQVITAACLLMRRSALDHVGMLDEEFINGFEDVDLCFRMGQCGYRLRYCGKSRVIHHESMTQGRGLHEQRNYKRLNDRWKSVIQPDESADQTALNSLEMQCRQRLITDPDNPRALSHLVRLWKQRGNVQETTEWQKRLQDATSGGRTFPVSVSIVIPVLNNLALTKQCLAAIEKTAGLTVSEIIVVDNASTDGTSEYLEDLSSKGALRTIRNETNLGFARGCNQGAAAARGKFVLFLNNDTVPTPGWLDFMTVAAHRPQVGVVGAKLLYPSGDIQHAGIGFINGVPDHPWRNASPLAPEVNGFRELDMVTGACFLMRRDLFLELGGFDEMYRNGVEDIDLCLRVRAGGRKVVYEPQAVLFHLEGQSAGRFNHVNENLQLFFRRWKNSFDADFRFVVPSTPETVRASQSVLLNTEERVTVSWEGSFLDYGSLSHVNREWTGALRKNSALQLHCVNTGAETPNVFENLILSQQAPSDVQVTVRHAWPPNWKRPARGKLVVTQPWEFGALPQEWVEQANAVDEFWVPTQLVRTFYLDSGIPDSKIKIVPYGVDTKRFQHSAAPRNLPTKKSFRFLFVGGTIHRKGPDVLLSAYLQSFTAGDDICLVIKDFGGNTFYKGQTLEQTIQEARQRPDAPEILYINDELTPEELPGLYTACHCLVHPYRGEGFGLPVLEAMACGLPVIVTGGGATDDFATEELAYRLPSKRQSIGDEISGLKLAGEGWLLEPDVKALAERMRWCVENREEARAKGLAASKEVSQRWTWEKAAESIVARLKEIHAREETAPNTKIATLPGCAELGSLVLTRELIGRGKHGEAWQATIAAIEARPFHPEAYLQLAKIALAAGAANEARSCAERARALAPHWEAPKQFLRKPLKGHSRPDWLKVPEPQGATRISVCLITRNEEQFLDRCLESVRGFAAQIVVVDTGSTDRTVQIAQKHGAEVHHFTWCDDFSAPRNAALEHARGDWILVLDADEELSKEQHAHLLNDVKNSKAIAFRLPLVNSGEEGSDTCVPRLFRNAPKAHFQGRIHEQAFNSLLAPAKTFGMVIGLGSAVIIHHGYSKAVTDSRAKVERNLRLLKLAAAETREDANIAMNLALELTRCGQEEQGLAEYRRAFRLFAARKQEGTSPELRETLLTQFTTALLKAGEKDELLRVMNSPVAKNGGLTASLHFVAGLVHLERKQYEQAAEHMRECIAKRQERTFAPINKDIQTAAPQHCLAQALAHLGDRKAAERAFHNALEESNSEQIQLDYARFLSESEQPVEALQMLHKIVTSNRTNEAAWKLGGEIATSRADFLEFANDWTREALISLPTSQEIVIQRAEVFLLMQAPNEALNLVQNAAMRTAKGRAVTILCQLCCDREIVSVSESEERQVSHEFIQLYRRLIEANAGEVIAGVNERLQALSGILPLAAQPLQAAVREANRLVAA